MLTEQAHIPPAVLLLLDAVSSSNSWSDARKRIRQLLPELGIQSSVFELQNTRRDEQRPKGGFFEVHLHGALDPLGGQGCIDPSCRLQAADRLARSVGLIADRIWLTDTLSSQFLSFGRATNAKLDEVLVDTLVIARLLPLINAGIIHFRSPWIATCAGCTAEFEHQLKFSIKEVLRTFRKEFRVEDLGEGAYVADTGKCFDPPMVYRVLRMPGHAIPTARAFADDAISDALRSTFWVAREAALTRGTLLTNSRVGIAGLLSQEGRLLDKRSLMLLEREREFSIPWVSDLTPEQVLQLREEASLALPAFRERFARALSQHANNESSQSPTALIDELRDQANEVRAELISKKKNSARFWRATYGLLGLGVSAYGVAMDQAAASVAGLLPLIQLLIEHETGHESEVARLSTKPGFVLVKAQDILAHAHPE